MYAFFKQIMKEFFFLLDQEKEPSKRISKTSEIFTRVLNKPVGHANSLSLAQH